MQTLEDVGINQYRFNQYAELLFNRENESDEPVGLVYTDIVSMIMRLRPGAYVNCCDFEYFRKSIAKGYNQIHSYLDSLEQLLEQAARLGEEEEDNAAADESNEMVATRMASEDQLAMEFYGDHLP